MNKTARSKKGLASLALVVGMLCGCSTFNAFEQRSDLAVRQSRFAGDIRVVRGKPNRVVDGVGKVFGIPNQIALGDRRVDNHSVSRETEQQVLHYLHDQQLDSVLVRVNQYNPVGEWKRMVANKSIRPGWKLTAGNYNLLKYTLLPGRITGGDWYNPYSQTLNLYSDVAPLAVSSAAYAQDISSRVNPGAYAALKEIPGLGLRHDTTAKNLTIDWYTNQHPDQLESAENILTSNYGASWGGQIGAFLPYGGVVGRVAGGLAGQAANAVRK